MCVCQYITVKPDQHHGITSADLVMDTFNLKPGFTKLYMDLDARKKQKLDIFSSALSKVNDRLYLSSLLFSDIFVKVYRKKVTDSEAHGPCVSFKTEVHHSNNIIESDIMLCFSCQVWPPEAREWLQRRRVNNWPGPDLISRIVADGCLVVPIGNPKSGESHMEWRISFSLAEKKLVHSMNHVQMVCYGLLKLYLKHVIESRADCKGLLCSYFLKTSLFYCIEEENLVWDKHNLLDCFWACFNRLFLWIRQGYCPNYFIKTNNMFESKVFGENQAKLKEHFFNLYKRGLHFLCDIPVLRDLHEHIFVSALRCTPDQLELEKINEYLCDLELLNIWNLTIFDLVDGSLIQAGVKKLLSLSDLQPVEKILLKNLLVNNHVQVSQFQYKVIANSVIPNKEKYRKLKALSRFILRHCTKLDICTGWLQYATLCYLTGNTKRVIYLVENILPKFKPSVMYMGQGLKDSINFDYVDEICGKGLTIQEKRNRAVACTFRCYPLLQFYPKEIEAEVNMHYRDFSPFVCIPPKIYSYVLLFLAYNNLGIIDLRNETLHKLLCSTKDTHFVTEIEEPLVSSILQRCIEIAA